MESSPKRPTFDPRIFISQPYITCPKCHKEDSYGVLSIHESSYTRRCRECWHNDSLSLPKLHKKIIYLDQFVISEMMKAVNTKLGKKEKIDPFFIALFEKLEKVTRAQLVVCPDSSFHEDESLSSKFYDALKQMYEHLSDGATFYDSHTIHRFQIQERYRAYVEGKKYKFKPQAESIIYATGGLHSWRNTLRVSASFKVTNEEIEEARKSKEKTRGDIAEIFTNRWKLEKDKNIKDWFKEEALAYGSQTVKIFADFTIKKHLLYQGSTEVTIDEILRLVTSEPVVLYSALVGFVDDEKVVEEYRKVALFLKSELMLDVPFNRLNALMWACIADSAAHGGRVKPPNRGTPNDLDMISTLLPYCDAIFVDKPMYAILDHKEVKKEISQYGTKIFSMQNKEKFMAYLDDILSNAPKEHIDKVKEVYGDEWDKPYWGMYK